MNCIKKQEKKTMLTGLPVTTGLISNIVISNKPINYWEIKMSLTQGKLNVTLPDGCRWIVKFNPKYPLLKDKYAIIGERNLTKAIEIANKKYFTFWNGLVSHISPIPELLKIKPEDNIANHPEIDFEAGMIEEALGGIE